MKKICFVTTVSITLKAFVLETAKYLHKKGGYDIYFVCNPDEEFAKLLPEYIHFLPVPMERGISLSGIKALLQMKKIFKQEKFDLVQYSTPNASCYASIAAKLAGVPVRLYCQWGIVYVGFSGLKRKIFKTIEKIVCHCSTRIEPDSFGNLRFSIAEKLYPEDKGAVVWNGSASGVDLKKFDYEKKAAWRSAIRRELKIPESALVYGFAGRITGEKGINELFQSARAVFAKHDDAWLMLVGDVEKADSVDQGLYQWAWEHDRVVFVGYTSVVEQYFAAMDVYLLPSYREGFGSAVVEAEAMGVPVVVSDIPGPTDAMLANETGLVVKKKDVAELIGAMEELYENEKKRILFGENARRFAIKRFEQQQLFAHILEDREGLLSEAK